MGTVDKRACDGLNMFEAYGNVGASAAAMTGAHGFGRPQESGQLNPKDEAARREDRAPLDLLEHSANILIARALKTGALKYGRRNFRLAPIQLSTYTAAIGRHVGALNDGEDLDPESGLPHEAHIGACVHVLLAAKDAGTLIDDRGPEERT